MTRASRDSVRGAGRARCARLGFVVGVVVAACAGAPPRAATAPRPSPARAWHRWVATEAFDEFLAAAPGPDGSVYALGRDKHGAFVARFAPDGERAWQHPLRGVTEGPPPALAVDRAGHVYVAGGFVGRFRVGDATLQSRGRKDVFLLRLDADGAVVWARQYGGPRFETAHDVATDARGNVYVTGSFQGAMDLGGGTSLDNGLDFAVFVAKLDSNGAHVWSTRLRDRGSTSTRGNALALGPDGDVYVTGVLSRDVTAPPPPTAGPPRDSRERAFVARMAQGGGLRWLRFLDTSGPAAGVGLALDPEGRVLVTGRFEGDLAVGPGAVHHAREDDVFVAAWGGRGEPLWARALGSAGVDVARAVAVDGAGDVFVAGATGGAVECAGERWPGEDADAFVARFDRDGAPRGHHLLATGEADVVNDLHVDGDGAALLAGAGGALRLGGTDHPSRGAVDAFVLRAPLASLGLAPSRAARPTRVVEGPPVLRAAPPDDGRTSWISIRLTSVDESTANVPFTVEGAPEPIEGTTTAAGVVEFQVPSDLTEVTLIIQDGLIRYPIRIGALDPIDEPSGQRARLAGIGYYYGPSESQDPTRAAEILRDGLRRLQEAQHLPVTGRADAATLRALRRATEGE